MTYNKADFRILKEKFEKILIGKDGEPLSCDLYDHPFSHGFIRIESTDGDPDEYHLAEACNIAAVIASISRIMSLPKSNIACAEMSEVLLLRLDVLREYICATVKTSHKGAYIETSADMTIKRWAGFLKHPSNYVFAHRCLSSTGVTYDPPTIEIDCSFLTAWDKLKLNERDQKKSDLAHRIVLIKLPDVEKIEAFFSSSANHINKLIAANTLVHS